MSGAFKQKSVSPKKKSGGWLAKLKRLRLRFVRKGINIHLVWFDVGENSPVLTAVVPSTGKGGGAAHAKHPAGHDYSNALKAVLDRHPGTRAVLVQLAALENALLVRGMKSLDDIPTDALKRALFQLETLVANGPSPVLTDLRARMSAALIAHEREDLRRSASAPLSNFQDSDRLQVHEATHSVFMEADAQWDRKHNDLPTRPAALTK